MRRVQPVNVQARISLGIAGLLRLFQHLGERQAFVLHARQDIVARAVENAVDALDLIAGEPLAQHADDRDAAAHARAEIEVHAVLFCSAENLLAALGQQLLVGRDHGFARVQRGQHQGLGHAGSADQLHDNLDAGVVDDRHRVGRQQRGLDRHAAVRRDVDVRDTLEHDLHAQPLRHHLAVALQAVRDTRAHGPESDKAHTDLLHTRLLSCYCQKKGSL
ncbi:MAG: hypothetical protein BWY57_02394 [Betaproteobacteria bacterium ADurb.Bin341]|nr:MAG: hypothetical protein BWY57_02394 [Betaproteobacteria bacterium ADurb.Bin341]